MLFLIYSATNLRTIESSLGLPEYSYYFVLKDFLPMLEQLGEIKIIHTPKLEVDAIYDACKKEGKDCLFLSFSPPHKTRLNLRCPTIPVFAWEFDTIPDEEWENHPQHNWVMCLQKTGSAIVHSNHTVNAVKRQLGNQFPVVAIWAPLWDRFESIRAHCKQNPSMHETTLSIKGRIIDSKNYIPYEFPPNGAHNQNQSKLHRRLRKYRRSITKRLSPLYQFTKNNVLSLVQSSSDATTELPPRGELSLKGIIYTSVFNPYDGRKNWLEMVIAFCTAFINNEDATLILKFTHRSHEWSCAALIETFRKLRPFKCRVIAIQGFIEEEHYNALIAHSSYVVNTSYSEGQCLPLMEYMSCGKPAITPCHTAMEDYINDEVAFIVSSEPEICSWPQDTRNCFRAHRYRLSYESLKDAYLQSYHVAKYEQERYKHMSEQCIKTLQQLCSIDSSKDKLDVFLKNTCHKEGKVFESRHLIDEPSTIY
ncbi:glycosyltransferase [uncultured Legionella sp.]|uniref:glycosyltransferase n=1 Tax=uncultured Legionella sp. TaxID=210934 RepID=UPI002606AFC0|nr:glycosyltransferase [uncultured Legionella sp.]